MEYPVRKSEIEEIFHNKIKVIRYNDLIHFRTVAELLKPYGMAVILYPIAAEDVGHWTCIFYSVNMSGRKIIEFFDPYGISIDREFNYNGNPRSRRLLAELLLTSKYPIEYNDYPLQKMEKNVNTCGRHVINRLLNRNMPLDIYAKTFGSAKGISSDYLVTYITNQIN